MKEIMISFGELCQIHDTMLKMNMVSEDTKITLLQDNSSGIGYTLSVSVPIDHKGVKGDFVVDFTDEGKW
jgi:hypothetical protein